VDGGPRITFVGHDASRTGAPTVLRSLLGWAASTGGHSAHLVLLRGGPLTEDYARHVPTEVLESSALRTAGLVALGLRAVWPRLPRRIEPLASSGRPIRATRPDVVVASSLAALEAAVHAVDGRCPVVCHVHELDGVAERILPAPGAGRDALLAGVERFVAAGPAVRTMLVDRWGIASSRVEVVDEFIDLPVVGPEQVARARVELGIAADRILVASAGTLGPRKGVDLFLDTVALLTTHRTRPAAAWVGGDPAADSWSESVHDLSAPDLADQVHLLGTRSDARPLLAAADVFLTTAREDPYPLVVLEAGALGVPVAGFASGGFGHVAAEAGVPDTVVEVGDVLGLVDVVVPLLESTDERRRHGEALATWVRSTHLTPHLAPRLWDAIVDAA
jgi:glycosyltransferase involved in cell wall biosynthesis